EPNDRSIRRITHLMLHPDQDGRLSLSPTTVKPDDNRTLRSCLLQDRRERFHEQPALQKVIFVGIQWNIGYEVDGSVVGGLAETKGPAPQCERGMIRITINGMATRSMDSRTVS